MRNAGPTTVVTTTRTVYLATRALGTVTNMALSVQDAKLAASPPKVNVLLPWAEPEFSPETAIQEPTVAEPDPSP